jgi:LmbE family N-acetylglucosaminyl deacetylase
MVFAPHQDDETLGCGGTMALKCASATPLWCVFMTDGSTSHSSLMSKPELCRLRRQEALAATEVLGLRSDDVYFLDFPDSMLAASHATAVRQVMTLLEQHRPEEVYVPYRCDGTPDHEATYRIVIEAVTTLGRRTTLLEYPVWYWNQWPWVPLSVGPGSGTLQALRRAAQSRFGLTMMKEFQCGVFVGEVIHKKREALSQHRSQMTVLRPGTPWPTLGDVSDGRFLECFFQDFEVFRYSELANTAPTL